MFNGHIVTFYTPEYEHHANTLKSRCDRLGLKTMFFRREPLGSWSTTTSMSAEVMHTAMHALDTPLLWLDADADLKKAPEIPDGGDVRAPVRPDNPLHRKWCVTSIYVNNTKGGKDFLARWKENSIWVRNKLCTDDYFFNRTCREMGSKLDIRPLPTAFFKNVLSGNAGKVHKEGMKKRHVKARWGKTPSPGNFGDILTPFMIDIELGVKPEHSPPFPGVIMGAGSTLRLAKGATVWGSGIMHYDDKISSKNNLLAVRGPISQRRCKELGIDPPIVYGDPGLLLPMFYDEPKPQAYAIGIVPHYVNYETALKMYDGRKDILVINPLRADVRQVIDEIRLCERVFSSSLHGLIAAHAYGIPYAWVKFKEPLDTDGSKFYDFSESVGMPNKEFYPYDITDPKDISYIDLANPLVLKGIEDFRALWDVCPFRLDNL
jgi:pyruvyltransferase